MESVAGWRSKAINYCVVGWCRSWRGVGFKGGERKKEKTACGDGSSAVSKRVATVAMVLSVLGQAELGTPSYGGLLHSSAEVG
jgi:hypothetical protein